MNKKLSQEQFLFIKFQIKTTVTQRYNNFIGEESEQ